MPHAKAASKGAGQGESDAFIKDAATMEREMRLERPPRMRPSLLPLRARPGGGTYMTKGLQ